MILFYKKDWNLENVRIAKYFNYGETVFWKIIRFENEKSYL